LSQTSRKATRIQAANVIGRVVAIERDGKMIDVN
jgi:hypothetical protein